MRWHQNPQRVAWIILLVNFVACCALTVVVPLAARNFVLHGTRPLTVYVTTTTGTAQLKLPGANDPTAVSERRVVPEGSEIATDKLAHAVVVIAADQGGQQVLTQLQLFPDSSVLLQRAQVPRFPWSRDPYSVQLQLESGRMRVVASDDDRTASVLLNTPQASTTSGEGTVDVVVRADDTQVTAVAGSAVVTAARSQVTVGEGQRVAVSTGRAPGLPVPAEQNLVLNGAFTGELVPNWKQVVEVDGAHEPGAVSREMDGERHVVHFTRRAEDGMPNMVGLRQDLNQDVQGQDRLVLQLDVQLLNQSVPGGGWRASEYPIMIDLAYTDIYGKDLHWRENFYWYDLPPGSNWERPVGVQVPLGVWYTYESENLIDVLKDTRPARINSITIQARGHDYESLVTDVALLAR
jgi:hypothetical protein